MHNELCGSQQRHVWEHAADRPERNRDAEREQSAGCRRGVEALQQAVDRHRRLKVDGRSDGAEPRRKQKRIEYDIAHDVQNGPDRRGCFPFC
jgi:hypothetical protein